MTGVLNMFQDLTGFMLCIVTYKIDNAKVRSVRRNIDTRNLFSKKIGLLQFVVTFLVVTILKLKEKNSPKRVLVFDRKIFENHVQTQEI